MNLVNLVNNPFKNPLLPTPIQYPICKLHDSSTTINTNIYFIKSPKLTSSLLIKNIENYLNVIKIKSNYTVDSYNSDVYLIPKDTLKCIIHPNNINNDLDINNTINNYLTSTKYNFTIDCKLLKNPDISINDILYEWKKVENISTLNKLGDGASKSVYKLEFGQRLVAAAKGYRNPIPFKEVTIHKLMQHPNIVKFYHGIKEKSGYTVIFTEYCPTMLSDKHKIRPVKRGHAEYYDMSNKGTQLRNSLYYDMSNNDLKIKHQDEKLGMSDKDKKTFNVNDKIIFSMPPHNHWYKAIVTTLPTTILTTFMSDNIILTYEETHDPVELKIPEDILKHYIKQLAEALQYMHTIGIVHGDIKFDNILIGSDEKPKLIDFGESKLIPYPSKLTDDRNKIWRNTKQRDIKALGNIILFMAANQELFVHRIYKPMSAQDINNDYIPSWEKQPKDEEMKELINIYGRGDPLLQHVLEYMTGCIVKQELSMDDVLKFPYFK